MKVFLQKLEKERLSLFEDLKNLDDNKLNLCNNRWSINQLLYHVWLAESSTEKYIRKKTQFPESIIKIKLSAYARSFIFKLFLDLGLKVKAPKIVTVFPKKITLDDLNKKWIKSRESFDSLIDFLNDTRLANKAIFNHQALGRLNLNLTLYFFKVHFRHHQKQIIALKKQL